MPLLAGVAGPVRITEALTPGAGESQVATLRAAEGVRWSPQTEADLEQFLLVSMKEAYGMLTEPYVDDLAAQGFMDILSASGTDVQQGLDFYGTIRLGIIWRARWLYRVAPMAKQALRIYTSFVLNTGFAKPLTKTHSQITRAQNAQAEDAAATASPGAAPQPGPPAPQTSDPSTDRRRVVAREAKPDTPPGAESGKPDPDPIQQVIDEHWDDPDNRQITTLDGLDETLTHRQVDGELFWALFVDEKTGHVKIRRLDPTRIVDIVTHPDDSARSLYYLVRRSNMLQDTAPGSSGAYERSSTLTSADATRVPNDPPGGGGTGATGTQNTDLVYRDWMNTDTDPARDPFRTRYDADDALQKGVVIAHFAINRLGKFGVSELFAGGDWLRAHKRFNENRASLTEALRRIALLLTIKGGQQQVSAAQSMLQSSLTSWGGGGGGGWESSPAPAQASVFAQNPGVQLEQFKVDTGASDATQDGEMLLQMYAASVGFATHYFGSGQMHVLATATAMELPILRYLQKEQTWWLGMLRQIVDFIVREAVRAGTIEGATLKERFGYDWVDWGDRDPSYDIEGPPIVNVDPQQTITAVTTAHQDGLITDEDAAHKAYVALGTENVDEHMGRWAAWHMQKQADAAVQAQAAPGPGGDGPQRPPEGPSRAAPGNQGRAMGTSPSGPSTAATQRAAREAAESPGTRTYDHATTQLDIPPEQARWIQRTAAISPEDLTDQGRETQPHITVLYGLHTTDPATLTALREVCRQTPPVRVRLGATATFPPSESSDGAAPLYVSVHSDEIHALRARLADVVAHTQTHPTYTPHITLAYLSPEHAARYAGNSALEGVELAIEALTVSGRDGESTRIPFTGDSRDVIPHPDAPLLMREAEKDKEDAGHWITIKQRGESTHIFINSAGTVTKGPAHLIGARAGHLPPITGTRTVTQHPPGHEPAGAREHPAFTEAPNDQKPQMTAEQAAAGLEHATAAAAHAQPTADRFQAHTPQIDAQNAHDAQDAQSVSDAQGLHDYIAKNVPPAEQRGFLGALATHAWLRAQPPLSKEENKAALALGSAITKDGMRAKSTLTDAAVAKLLAPLGSSLAHELPAFLDRTEKEKERLAHMERQSAALRAQQQQDTARTANMPPPPRSAWDKPLGTDPDTLDSTKADYKHPQIAGYQRTARQMFEEKVGNYNRAALERAQESQGDTPFYVWIDARANKDTPFSVRNADEYDDAPTFFATQEEAEAEAERRNTAPRRYNAIRSGTTPAQPLSVAALQTAARSGAIGPKTTDLTETRALRDKTVAGYTRMVHDLDSGALLDRKDMKNRIALERAVDLRALGVTPQEIKRFNTLLFIPTRPPGSNPDQVYDDYDRAATTMVKNWAESSVDDHEHSVALQMMAQEMFDLPAWKRPAYTSSDTWAQARALLRNKAYRKVTAAFVTSVYQATQRTLEEAGFGDTVPLYRGLAGVNHPALEREVAAARAPHAPGEPWMARGTLESGSLHEQPLNSFSLNPHLSARYAHDASQLTEGLPLHVHANVPRSRIFSTFRTGPGAMHEAEFIVMGQHDVPYNYVSASSQRALRDGYGIPAGLEPTDIDAHELVRQQLADEGDT